MDTSITREEVLRWALSLKDNEFVGQTNSAAWCPLAMYYRSLGYEEVFVTPEWIYYDGTQIPSPTWVAKVIAFVDLRKEITAFELVKLMKEVRS